MLHNTYVYIFTNIQSSGSCFSFSLSRSGSCLLSSFRLLSSSTSISMPLLLYWSLGVSLAMDMRLDENKIQIMAHQCCNRISEAWHTVPDDRWQLWKRTREISIWYERTMAIFEIEWSESEKKEKIWSDRVEMNKIYCRLNQMPLSMHTMRIRTHTMPPSSLSLRVCVRFRTAHYTSHNFSLVWRINTALRFTQITFGRKYFWFGYFGAVRVSTPFRFAIALFYANLRSL